MKSYTITSVVYIRQVIQSTDEDNAIDIAGNKIASLLDNFDCDYEFDSDPVIEDVE